MSERTLSLREFRALARTADPSRESIRKTRRAFLWDNAYYLLDTFLAPASAAGTTTLFVEDAEAKRPSPPPFLRLVEDVTTTQWFSSVVRDGDIGPPGAGARGA